MDEESMEGLLVLILTMIFIGGYIAYVALQ